MTEAINEYGPEKIGGVQVGNEYLLNAGTVTGLLGFVEKFRETARANNWTFPIGTGDAASMFSAQLGAGIDFFMGNNRECSRSSIVKLVNIQFKYLTFFFCGDLYLSLDPWFAGVTVEDAPGWTWNYWQTSTVEVAATLANTPKVYIGEVSIQFFSL